MGYVIDVPSRRFSYEKPVGEYLVESCFGL